MKGKYFNWQSYSFAECVVIENRQKERKETRSLRKEAQTFTLNANSGCHAPFMPYIAFASAYLFLFAYNYIPFNVFCLSFLFLACRFFSLLFYFFQKAIKAALHCLGACVGVCVKPEHSYIFMIILICVASKFSHKASI